MKIAKNQDFTITYILTKWLPILLILFFASILYFYQINRESLWIDEIWSIIYAKKHPFASFNRALYPILLSVWMRFGDNEAWLRSLSVVFGLISIWLIYQLGMRLADRATGLIAALLLTLSPLVINHAQEVRMYVLSMCLGLGGSLILTFLLKRPKISLCLWWLSLRIMAVLTTPINILLLLPDALILGWQFFSQPEKKLIVLKKWFWLFGILIIPAVIIIKDVVPPLIEFLGVPEFSHQIGIAAFFGAITRFTILYLNSPVEQLSWFYEHIFVNLYALVLVILLGVAWFNRKKLTALWWIAAWGFCPSIAIFALSQFFPTLWGVDRYILFTAPYIFIILAKGFIQVWRWRKIVAVAIAAIYVIAVSGSLIRHYNLPYREDWRGVAQTITIAGQPNDAIALFPEQYLVALDYYYQGANPIFTIEMPPREKYFRPIDKPSLEKMLNELPKFHARLWLVFAWAHTSIEDRNNIVPSVLQEHFELEYFQKFTGIDLFLIEAKSTK